MAVLVVVFGRPCQAAVWQWSVSVDGGTDKAGPARAFLWIPHSCRQIRGVVIAQNNMEEQMILENATFRTAMAHLHFAEVWVSPPFDHLFLFNQGAGNVFDGMMSALAAASGYHELTFDPIVPLGHSAAASWPYYFAAWNPDRTLAALSVSGQWPYFRSPVFAPDIWGDKNIDEVPCLETMGEYESANTWSTEGLKERQQHPLLPLSMAAGPAQGHFFATQAKIDYLILYIQKAVQYRIPRNWNGEAAPHLIPINPTQTGWLADKWRKDQPPIAPPAPIGQYKGDPTQAFWYFDQKMADATVRDEAADRDQKADLLGFMQDGRLVPQSNTHQQINLKFEPDADGVTFHLHAVFLQTVPAGSPYPAEWAGLPVGSPIGHATGGGAISIERISGPFKKIGPHTFILHFEHGMERNLTRYELWFAATQSGDHVYKPAIQQAQMLIPARNTQGQAQQIMFPVIPDQKEGEGPLTLRATSDAGVPVHYFVREGPAMVNGNILRFTPIPPRTKFPVRVTVVAWQYGRSVPPLLQTARSVRQTFFILAR